MKKFFSELWHRLKSNTPPFFKKIQAVGGIISTAGVGMMTTGNIQGGGITAGAGALISFVAGLACTPSSDDVKNNVTNKQ